MDDEPADYHPWRHQPYPAKPRVDENRFADDGTVLDGERISRVVEVALGEDTLVGDRLYPMSIRPAVAPEGDDIAGVIVASLLGDNERANWCGSRHAWRCDKKDTHAERHHHGNEASKTEA